MNKWWLSFVGSDGAFLGGVITRGFSMIDAVHTAHALKINPGGEVAGVIIPQKYLKDIIPFENRLLNEHQATLIDTWLNRH